MELFNAVSCLPEHESLSRWSSVARHFNKGYSEPALTPSPSVQSEEYEILLQPAPMKPNQCVQPSLSLPSNVRSVFVTSQEHSLGTVACPCCQQLLNICIANKSQLELKHSSVKPPLLPLPESSSSHPVTAAPTESSGTYQKTTSTVNYQESVVCAFSGMPYVVGAVEQCQERNWSLQKKQGAIEVSYQSSSPDSTICVARNLPISSSRQV